MKQVVNLFCFLIFSANAFAQAEYLVLFEYDKYEVPDTAMAALVKIIFTNQVRKIYLEGHCDSIGGKAYNYALSENRVKAVENLLIENGFDPNNIVGKVGFGKDKPLLPNSDEDNRQMNRRVYVKFDIIGTVAQQKSDAKAETSSIEEERPEVKITEKKELGIAIDQFDSKPAITPQAAKAKEFKRENFVANNTVALPNLLFEGGRHILMRGSYPILDSLIKILTDKNDLKIEVQGHVCCTTFQADGYDWDTGTEDLSWQRAKAIKNLLIQNGISSLRVQIRGFGGSKKLYPKEEDEYQRAQNRRVEIFILPEKI